MPHTTTPRADRCGTVPEFLERTQRLFGREALAMLHQRKVAIAGCGGVGGAASVLLARLGVQRFHLADPGTFDPPDQNRQWGASAATMGRNKALVHEEMLREIAPEADVRTFTEGVTDANVDAFLDGCDLLVDSLDLAVPGPLRLRVYERAHQLGMPAVSAPILGLGALVAVAAPPGPSLAMFAEVLVGPTLASGRLPPQLNALMTPAHLDALVRSLPERRAPSNSIAVALATSVACTEAVMALTGPALPGWRPPVALPNVTVVDLARPMLTTLDIGALKPNAPSNQSAPAPAASSPGAEQRRQAALERAGFNVANLPADAVEIDLSTDSWSERQDLPAAPQGPAPWSPEDVLRPMYGFEHVVPVFRGRFAESLLCRALLRPGAKVPTNAVFPTTHFHIMAAGATPLFAGVDDGVQHNASEFRGDIDLETLERLAASQDIAAVWVELCCNAIGGQPVSMANLRALRNLADRRGFRIVLDTTRAFTNAALIRQREQGYATRSLASIVAEQCSYADACAGSLTKEFCVSRGAFVGVRESGLAAALTDLAHLGYGDGLDGAHRHALAGALTCDQEGPLGVGRRVAQVRHLAQGLYDGGVPVALASGGHALFIDAAAALGSLPDHADAAASLCGALYRFSGVRASPHLGSPQQQAAGKTWVRIALPVGIDLAPIQQGVREALVHLRPALETVSPLFPCPPSTRGLVGEMTRRYGTAAQRRAEEM